MNLPDEGHLFLLPRVQFVGGADVEPDSLLSLALVERTCRRSGLSWTVLSYHRFPTICSRGTPAIEVPIDRTDGASVAFFEKLLVQLLSFFPAPAQVGSVGIERTGASGSGFHFIGEPLANRSSRTPDARSNLFGRKSLAFESEHLLLAIQPLFLTGSEGARSNGFACSTFLSPGGSRLLTGFAFFPASFFERIFFSGWGLLLGRFADLRTHPCQKGDEVFAEVARV